MSSRRLALAALLSALPACDPQDVNEGDFVFAATVRASVGAGGLQSDGDSFEPRLSGDGVFVVFVSRARNLVALDTGGLENVFRRNLRTGIIELVSAGLLGVASDGSSDQPSVSGDGNLVVFRSAATNLTADPDAGIEDIFLRDMAAGTTVRVTEAMGGGEADGPSSFPAISSDGQSVAFQSDATDLVAGDGNGLTDVFRRALPAGAVERVSVSESGTEVSAGSVAGYAPSISADGSVVAFVSDCTDMVAGKGGFFEDVFVRDFNALVAPFTVRISQALGGGDALGNSQSPSISADGRFVAFSSDAPDIVVVDPDFQFDVFVCDRQTGLTVLASVNSGEAHTTVDCEAPSLSGDGLLVAFRSFASNLVTGDTNGMRDVFLRDLGKGTTIRLSVSTLGTQTNPPDGSTQQSISRDGRFVAFVSESAVLVGDDTNGLQDVFVRGPLR